MDHKKDTISKKKQDIVKFSSKNNKTTLTIATKLITEQQNK